MLSSEAARESARVSRTPSAALGRLEPWLAALVIALACGLAVHHLIGDAATTDEPVHLASAVEIVRQGTGRGNPEHPPLATALADTDPTTLIATAEAVEKALPKSDPDARSYFLDLHAP